MRVHKAKVCLLNLVAAVMVLRSAWLLVVGIVVLDGGKLAVFALRTMNEFKVDFFGVQSAVAGYSSELLESSAFIEHIRALVVQVEALNYDISFVAEGFFRDRQFIKVVIVCVLVIFFGKFVDLKVFLLDQFFRKPLNNFLKLDLTGNIFLCKICEKKKAN